MTEILLADATGAVTGILAEAKERAKQLPQPVTFHLLCTLPDISET